MTTCLTSKFAAVSTALAVVSFVAFAQPSFAEESTLGASPAQEIAEDSSASPTTSDVVVEAEAEVVEGAEGAVQDDE